MTAWLPRGRQAGLTLIEIMVSVALVGIATAFVFSIQMKMSSALRDQQTVSETQQTLRSATELLIRDLRMSGYLAQQVAIVPGTAPWTAGLIGPVTVVNGGVDGAPDQLLLAYADTSAVAMINSNTALAPAIANASVPPGYASSTGTYIGTISGAFVNGDTVIMTHAGASTASTAIGIGCVLGVSSVTGGASPLIKTDPAGGAPWNSPANGHCSAGDFPTIYSDGLTEISKVVVRAYRIRPADLRGVLEMSPSGGRVADWQPLALGIVDMQIAVRLSYPADQVGFCATDGDLRHDWLSSDNMNAIPLPLPATNPRIVEVSITLLAKTTKEVQGVVIAKTPDLFDGDLAHRGCNHVGDVTGTTLPVAPPTSMYFGDHAYRTYTATVDLRNATAQN